MQYLNKTRLGLVLAVLAGLLAFMVPAVWAEPAYESDLLIETGELPELLKQPNVVLVDAVDEATYQRIHIPGAVNLFFNQFANLETRRKSGFPASEKDAGKLLGDAGMDNDTLVIVYDDGEGVMASGLWFALDFFGHEKVKVLNGGFRKWMKEGRPVTQDAPAVIKKKFVARARPDMVVTRKWVKKNMHDENTLLVDARSPDEFTGKDLLPGIKRGGHIPGAVNLDWVNLSDKLNTFKSADDIKAILAKAGITPDTRVVSYCQQGIGRATFLVMAMKLAGYDNVLEYTGSWQDWSTDQTLPVEKK
ncbi:MAG: sulfurtransferase [Gammaproteobacteria bacterium]|nr:MAG: sulfurtransferase [Gammaproteobacteria bacterium]